ncbi:unnamed protein product [Mytilus edulis]|uniref:Ubiquitin-like protease family profile domain-containing protein n=1 Tax=Mytilus edulis TaxID=6550 RepID=A0A8S3USA4_MYTED|nr:unnamed protein product [Mytilus edulis]
MPHGNSKHDTEFVRTMPSVIDTIKEKEGNPHKVYKKMICTNDVDGSHQAVANPRNTKQVKNILSKDRQEKALSKDDIYNLVLLAYQLDGFVSEVLVYPDLYAVVALPEIINAFKDIDGNPTKKTKTQSNLPWIGYCSQQHKQNILNNKYLCSDIIISTQNLLKFEFPEINGFQETTLAPVKVDGKWVSETGFQSQESPSVQIHHNGNAHWVLSLQTRDGNIYLLDSLSLNLTTSLEYQLTQIYGKDKKKLIIRIPDVQKQQNSIDCGLFAIANALEFCQTGFKGGTHITYEQKYMREHLIHCLENGKFTHFPKNYFGKTPKI